jgi:hypothetical protein
MSAANSIIVALLDIALSPFRDVSPLAGLAVVSAAAAMLMLLVVRATSNQTRLAAVKRSIQACVFEVRLFGDDARAIFRALGEMLRHNLTYLRLSLVPLLWMALPFGFLLVHLDGYYGVGELMPGRQVLVKVRMAGAASSAPELMAPDGVRIETPAVWIPSLREAVWRVVVERPGSYELNITTGSATVTKQLSAMSGIVRRSPVRPDGRIFEQLRFPAERPLPGNSGIESVTVTYPSREISVLGWDVHWLVVFFMLSMAFAFALRSPLKVVI